MRKTIYSIYTHIPPDTSNNTVLWIRLYFSTVDDNFHNMKPLLISAHIGKIYTIFLKKA